MDPFSFTAVYEFFEVDGTFTLLLYSVQIPSVCFNKRFKKEASCFIIKNTYFCETAKPAEDVPS